MPPLSNLTIVSSGFNLRDTYRCFSFSDFCKSVDALKISLNNCLITLSLKGPGYDPLIH